MSHRSETITHLEVPIAVEDRRVCLGPNGSAAHVARIVDMLKGRWKLAILFRLFADSALRTARLLQDMPGLSQKVLTQHLRELAAHGLIERIDYGETPLRVEYRLTDMGRGLLPVLLAMRNFAVDHPLKA